MGIATITALSVVFYKQTMDIYAMCGVLMIVTGTLLITTKSAVVFQ
jgi:small multidrug resistance pump